MVSHQVWTSGARMRYLQRFIETAHDVTDVADAVVGLGAGDLEASLAVWLRGTASTPAEAACARRARSGDLTRAHIGRAVRFSDVAGLTAARRALSPCPPALLEISREVDLNRFIGCFPRGCLASDAFGRYAPLLYRATDRRAPPRTTRRRENPIGSCCSSRSRRIPLRADPGHCCEWLRRLLSLLTRVRFHF